MTGAKEKRPLFVVVLRGPAGVGKTTLARAVQAAAPGRAAVIYTDLFQWEIVPGEPDKRPVYQNVLLLAHNYPRHGYGVILSGLILNREEAGAMEELRGFGRAHAAPFLDFYCHAPLEVALVERGPARHKEVPEAAIAEWWHLARADRENVARWGLTELDMRDEPAALAGRAVRVLEKSTPVPSRDPPLSRLFTVHTLTLLVYTRSRKWLQRSGHTKVERRRVTPGLPWGRRGCSRWFLSSSPLLSWRVAGLGVARGARGVSPATSPGSAFPRK